MSSYNPLQPEAAASPAVSDKELSNMDQAVSEELKQAMKNGGEVFLPTDADFKEATKVNQVGIKPLRVPAIVARPKSTEDVSACVRFAVSRKLPLSVRGGGHSVQNASLCSGGLVIDMSALQSVSVNGVSKTVRVGGGVTFQMIDTATAPENLAAPLGVCSNVGLGSALAGGGYGFTGRAFGSIAGSILEAELVTADGSITKASASENPDLFWAVRGCGSAFGVVTQLTLRLYDVSEFVGGVMVWPDDAAHANFWSICKWMRDSGAGDTNFAINLSRVVSPEGPILLGLIYYVGTEKSRAQKLEFLEPIRGLGTIQDEVGNMPFLAVQSFFWDMERNKAAVETPQPSVHYWGGGTFLNGQLDDGFLDIMTGIFDALPPEAANSILQVDMIGGAIKNADIPIGFKDADFATWLILQCPADLADEGKFVEVARNLKARLAPVVQIDVYSNMCSDDDGARVAARVGGASNLERLRTLKAKWDPGNVFQYHHFDGLVYRLAIETP